MSARMPTTKERLARAEAAIRFETERAEALWFALHKVATGHEIGAGTAAVIAEVLASTVRCSCGSYASCWMGGKGPKMCERCMST